MKAQSRPLAKRTASEASHLSPTVEDAENAKPSAHLKMYPISQRHPTAVPLSPDGHIRMTMEFVIVQTVSNPRIRTITEDTESVESGLSNPHCHGVRWQPSNSPARIQATGALTRHTYARVPLFRFGKSPTPQVQLDRPASWQCDKLHSSYRMTKRN